MEIIVEVGTTDERNSIRNELRAFFEATSKNFPDLRIYKVIVPADFDSTVIKLQENSNYRSVRPFGEHKINAQAKTINTPEGFCLVISFRIYFSERQDFQTRHFIYIHEFTHLVNNSKFIAENIQTQSDSIYSHNLEVFIDEYIADRTAYSIIDKTFPSKSELWKTELEREAHSFANALLDLSHLKAIKNSIRLLQTHKNITFFLDEIHPLIDGAFLILAHSFSLSDSYPNQLPFSELANSPFVNGRTIALLDYARSVYSKKCPYSTAGIPIVKEFMQNFGIVFSDSSDGLICHVDYSDF